MLEIVGGIVVLLLTILFSGIKAVKEYNALVIYRAGKISRCVGSGLQFVLPLIEKSESIDVRVVTLPLPAVEETTIDHYSVKVSAVLFYQVVDPKRCLSKVQDVAQATAEICEVAVRTMVGQHDLRHLLSERTRINWTLKTVLERRLRDFGVRVVSIEVKEVQLSREAKKALSRSMNGGKNGERPTITQEERLIESFLRIDPPRDS
jgi:regulator of protease activity HflC (stomatin/prohibitin superfamily)